MGSRVYLALGASIIMGPLCLRQGFIHAGGAFCVGGADIHAARTLGSESLGV